MVLKNNFYKIKTSSIEAGKATFRVALQSKHFVYQAHFPNNPITPGVILIQIAVELFEEIQNSHYSIQTLKNVKFIAPVSPLEFPETDFLLEFSGNNLKVLIKEKENVFAKMSIMVARTTKPQIQYSIPKFCIIIPVYNAENLIGDVIKSVLQCADNLIIVNDGSTDGTLAAIAGADLQAVPLITATHRLQIGESAVELVSYEKNRGKGYALQHGFKRALELGFTHAVTLDADGQHLASDISVMAQRATENPDSLIVGSRKFDNQNMPQGNVFANNFSNFWFMLQTAKKLPDTQTGFRVYPLQKIGKMRLFTNRYEAELELLVRSAWRGILLVSQPINVYYPPVNERVSHFRGGKDFFRISVLNSVLCFAAIIYGYPNMLIRKILSIQK
ncbi:MAG: glycosyltransferase [Prevotellaceae bacterium]|jgi:glycosyltransferase involved in cell wall biosynthesis/3-hydroxymyristoyl/3-hydroxydecanoyl-(acyl carrier protein) dehydratase|nr:glycosyltransferase [Prevotellaceae bacterium]